MPAGTQQPQDIQVTVDENGVVSDVVIPARWEETVTPQGLGDLLRERANEAVARRIGEQLDNSGEPVVAAPLATGTAAPDLGDPDVLLAEVMRLFAQVDGELAAFADQVRTAASANYVAAGMNSRASVTISHGQVTAVALDQRWLASARYTEIRAEVLSAFQAAARQVASSGAGAVPVPPALARLQQLASDPVALNQRLGQAR